MAPTPAVALQHAVGTSLVGSGAVASDGVPPCLTTTGIGILPNANDLFEVQELAVYDQ